MKSPYILSVAINELGVSCTVLPTSIPSRTSYLASPPFWVKPFKSLPSKRSTQGVSSFGVWSQADRNINTGMTIKIKGYLICLLYTSDAADDLLCVDLGGRRI